MSSREAGLKVALAAQSHYQLGLLAAHLKEYQYKMFSSMSNINMHILSQVSSKQAGWIVALHNQVRARVARGEEKRGRSLLHLLI